ncbi:MAG TPA: hypothetical protein VGE21_01465 [Flavobacteriales bacterium]
MDFVEYIQAVGLALALFAAGAGGLLWLLKKIGERAIERAFLAKEKELDHIYRAKEREIDHRFRLIEQKEVKKVDLVEGEKFQLNLKVQELLFEVDNLLFDLDTIYTSVKNSPTMERVHERYVKLHGMNAKLKEIGHRGRAILDSRYNNSILYLATSLLNVEIWLGAFLGRGTEEERSKDMEEDITSLIHDARQYIARVMKHIRVSFASSADKSLEQEEGRPPRHPS